MPIAFNYEARSDVGMVRTNNEDSGYAGPHLLAMADHPTWIGKRASRNA